ncbi:transmembrane protein 200C-like [Anguilla anguilla]|uniref:transmembrane protein 200C-like n=1 Tax=Anguilla anguilla TaxID=7936 RepID=UPI0015AD7E27|nr:transmembrane protein 200C-like [Anguilla anguilla]XP_035285421.1 transmembrane protein 200C-like [Anguilla anguilla]
MIATGGLLRISARRQDSLRAKNRAENKRKRKAKKKRKNDVVVIKGKLKLFSVSGLVAAVGVVILLVGVAMAMLGYWPKESLAYPEPQLSGKVEKHQSSFNRTLPESNNWTVSGTLGFSVSEDLVNYSQTNGTDTATPPLGVIDRFLARCLYSDELKVFGPLVMGVGIFLFICANAVLHENRDRNTKIINLRDIYSTVIDIHSLRTKDCTPLNGFVNYVQSRSIDGKPGPAYNAAMLARSSWPSTVSGKAQERVGPRPFGRRSSSSRERQTFTDTVYSIYRDQNRTIERAPVPKPWETRTIVTSSVNAFTLPVIKLNNCVLEEPKRLGGGEGRGDAGGAPEEVQADCSRGDGSGDKTKAESSRAGPFVCQGSAETQEGSGGQQGAPRASLQGSQAQLLPPSPGLRPIGSHVSLSALSDYSRSVDPGASPSGQGDRTRRLSCPRLDRSCSKGYIKLGDLGGESFESSDTGAPIMTVTGEGVSQGQASQATPHPGAGASNKPPRGSPWKYFNREKLVMISQSNPSEEDGELESTGI